MYYSRQLNNYNLCVYEYHDKTGCNYLWNETTAKRGSTEIALCVMTYLGILNQKGSYKTVRLSSDSCGDPNRYRP